MKLNFGRSVYLIGLTLTFCLSGCSESAMTGSANSKKDRKSETNANPNKKPAVNTGDSNPESIDTGDGTVDVTNDPNTCLFMVSGAAWGHTVSRSLGSTFPLPKSGGAPTHGASFDDVGGVFLKSSETPYEYHKGAGEINAAVDSSFDSIVIPPGVEVEIRRGNGQVITKTKGPYMAYADYYGAQFKSSAYLANVLKDAESKMPPWFKKYLTEKNYNIDLLNLFTSVTPGDLSNAHYVKVTKIPWVPCDQY